MNSTNNLQVLYEDNHLIAVVKPAGVLVQGDKSGDETLMDMVKLYLREKYNKTGNVFLGLLHRLDRNVSGIVLFAKTSKGAARLSEQIRNRKVKKTYTAILEKIPEKKSVKLVHYLRRDTQKNKVWAYDERQPDTEEAILEYEVIEQMGDMAKVKVNLVTGRHHQIRAQMAAIKCPIQGDTKYGAKIQNPDRSISLCASALEFETATGGEMVLLKYDTL